MRAMAALPLRIIHSARKVRRSFFNSYFTMSPTRTHTPSARVHLPFAIASSTSTLLMYVIIFVCFLSQHFAVAQRSSRVAALLRPAAATYIIAAVSLFTRGNFPRLPFMGPRTSLARQRLIPCVCAFSIPFGLIFDLLLRYASILEYKYGEHSLVRSQNE